MQPFIREKRKINFAYRIIKPHHIQQIAKIINQENIAANANKDVSSFVIYSVDATDNSSYESKSPIIFGDLGLLYTKVIHKVQMRFQTSNNEKNIEVQFLQILENETGNNYINVSGDDATWVNGIISRFSEIINSAQEQPKTHLVIDNLAIPVAIIFNVLFFRIFYTYIEHISYDWIRLVITFGIPIGTLLLFNRMSEYLKTLWPSMELQTGPKYLQATAMKRRKMNWILGSIFIPLLIGFLYDLLKSYILK